MKLTKRQKEVIEYVTYDGKGVSSETAQTVSGGDYDVAINLLKKHVFNMRKHQWRELFWLRQENETPTGFDATKFIMIYGSPDLSNGRNFAILKTTQELNWHKIVVPALRRLVKNHLHFSEWYIEGSSQLDYDSKANMSFDFDGTDFVKVNKDTD